MDVPGAEQGVRVEELQNRLAEFCAAHGLERFSPEEIVELLEDGEEVDWIVEQVAPGSDVAGQLGSLLKQIAEETAPMGAVGAETGEAASTLEEVVSETAAGGDAGDETATDPAGGPEAAPSPAAVAGDLQTAALPDLSALRDVELPEGMDRGQVEQLLSSPQGALLADFGLFCQEKGVSPDEAATIGKNPEGPLAELREEWLDTPRESLEGRRPVELLQEGGMFGRVGTYRREVPKTGRNDPCPCGSGKKYKKCCGKGV